MYGFLIVKGNAKKPQTSVLENCKEISCGEMHIYYAPLPKFENDHLFFEDEEKVVLLDGVIFNKRELLEQYNNNNWRYVFEQMYTTNPEGFFNSFRGSFCGAIFNKLEETVCLFTNHSGEKTVYYTYQKSVFAAASHNNILIDFLNSQEISLSPNIQACRELLATGSVLHGGTPFSNVFRLTAGKYLIAHKDGSYEEFRYHMFHNVPEHDLTLDECVEELDKRFRKAIDRIFSKNVEYGYKAECDLSGGLDSRMATWVAHDMGYQNILNVCYCQSGKIDHTTSKKIAQDLGNDYYFIPMDGGDFLMDIDEVVEKFGGQVIYCICTGANQAIKEISKRGVGLSVTGLLGELHNAYWVEGAEHTAPNYIKNRYSGVCPLNIPNSYKEGYDNYEQMNLYEYSNLLYLSSANVRQQYCEVTSPFIDVDYLEFAYRVPLKWRQNYFLTMTWMMKKYPQAAKYVWQTKRMPVSNYFNHKIYWRKVLNDIVYIPKWIINRVAWKLRLPIQFLLSSDMNPLNLWLLSNKKLKEFLEQYYRKNIDRIEDPGLREDVRKTFEKGYGYDKICAINLLGVFKRYF